MKKADDDDELKTELMGIRTAAYEAANLVQALVKLSRAGDEEKIQLNPTVVLKEIVRFARSVIPATIKMVARLDTDCGMVRVNLVSLNYLFVLLISEAIKTMKDGGELVIELRGENKDGIGPSKLVCTVIMQKQETENRENEQIALAENRFEAMKSLANSAGVSIEPTADEKALDQAGVRIVFDREQSSDTQPLSPGKIVSRDIATSKGEKILLVEDEPMLARLLKRALEKAGYQVTIADNGMDGLVKWSSGTKYDLILTDMTMPEMCGTELAEKIIEKKPDAKIILCTGFSDQVDEETAKGIGIKRYLEKPVGNRELLAAIRKCIDEDYNNRLR